MNANKPLNKHSKRTEGLVIVYIGEGKGKTTAALGLILRASGYGKKILMMQFGKTWFTGEIKGIKKLGSNVKLIQSGRGFVKILNDKLPLEDHKNAARAAFEALYKEIISGKWDLVIADEIVGAVAGKILPLESVLKLIQDKPKGLDLVLTGRLADPKIIAKADLVTEMKSIKHPFEKGIVAKEGIDY